MKSKNFNCSIVELANISQIITSIDEYIRLVKNGSPQDVTLKEQKIYSYLGKRIIVPSDRVIMTEIDCSKMEEEINNMLQKRELNGDLDDIDYPYLHNIRTENLPLVDPMIERNILFNVGKKNHIRLGNDLALFYPVTVKRNNNNLFAFSTSDRGIEEERSNMRR